MTLLMAQFGFGISGSSDPGPGFGVVTAGGDLSIGYVYTTQKRTYATDTVTYGTNITQERNQGGAAGNNNILAICGGAVGGGSGSLASSSLIYAYATDTWSSGSNLTTSRFSLAACGTASMGYYGSGLIATTGLPESLTAVLNKYEYTTNSMTTGTSISAKRSYSAAGNDTVGIFGPGFYMRIQSAQNPVPVATPVSIVNKYTYSSDAVTSFSSVTLNNHNVSPATVGTNQYGYFCGSGTVGSSTWRATITRYTYADDTYVDIAGVLSSARSGATGNCNKSIGIIAGGQTGSSTYTTASDKLTFTTESVSSVNSLLVDGKYAHGGGTTPGGFS